jgi:hypothetical protein
MAAIQEAISRGFDDLPVLRDSCVIGVVPLDRLAANESAPAELVEMLTDKRAERFMVTPRDGRIPVLPLIQRLAQVRSVILLPKLNVTDQPLGFITLSDLNRQAVRAAVYLSLAELEAEVALIVERTFADPWDWMRHLNEVAQVALLGNWDLSKRRGIDVGPVAAATLTHLLTAVTHTQQLRQSLGYDSRKVCDADLSRLPELRNRVMHPVRPFILSAEDAARMARALSTAIELLAKAQSVTTAFSSQQAQ